MNHPWSVFDLYFCRMYHQLCHLSNIHKYYTSLRHKYELNRGLRYNDKLIDILLPVARITE
jgi:hypothetical protein